MSLSRVEQHTSARFSPAQEIKYSSFLRASRQQKGKIEVWWRAQIEILKKRGFDILLGLFKYGAAFSILMRESAVAACYTCVAHRYSCCPFFLHRARLVRMEEREGAAPRADARKDLAPVVASEEIPSKNDSTAPTSTTVSAGGRELGLELITPPSLSTSLPIPTSLPQEDTTRPPFTSPPQTSVSHSQDSTAQPPQAPSPVESSTGNRSNASATDSGREPESPSLHPVQRSTGTGPEVPPLENPRSRTRVRAPVESLPPAFPPPSRRASESDGDGSSSASSQSPLAPNDPGVEDEEGGELDVNASSTSELELSVPSHKEHLTADGQR